MRELVSKKKNGPLATPESKEERVSEEWVRELEGLLYREGALV